MEHSPPVVNAESPSREFLEQFVHVQRRLYVFLLAQAGSPQIADDVLQNVNVVALSKWQQFEPGTNFLAWVYRIATLELLKYRQKSARNKLVFNDDYLAQISNAVTELSEQSEQRRQALAFCLKKLKKKDRELVRLRYQQGLDGETLSEKLSRPINSIYQSLGRIRRALLTCIEKQILLEGRQ
ncbi:MAG: sigma-70 family RNA polymerase sigma factor [Planctomycetaceae bacterium]|nr:sigma-70 family RNA polymerase sigma factor [Planctomycetaceae bacterium]